MKKIVVAGLVAVGLMAITQQQASAWINSKFGIGLNWDVQSGGNQVLWGAWRNGQPPGPEAFGGYGGGGYYQGGMPGHAYAPMPQAAPPQGSFDRPMYQAPYAVQQYQNPFQFATYSRPVQYYYYPAQPYYYYYYYGY
jgi:hypothetical protein